MNKELIIEKVTELFVCKGRNLTPEIGLVWVKKLCNRYPDDLICEAIDEIIWNEDDFPTIGKIAAQVNKIKEKYAHNIFVDILFDKMLVPEGIIWNLNRDMVRENDDLFNKRVKEFIGKYKEILFESRNRQSSITGQDSSGQKQLEG